MIKLMRTTPHLPWISSPSVTYLSLAKNTAPLRCCQNCAFEAEREKKMKISVQLFLGNSLPKNDEECHSTLVSVPCSSLFDIVTVRCGHCTNLWSVNMAAAFQSLSWQDVQAPNYTSPDYRNDLGSSSKCNTKMAMRAPASNITEERIVNRPPEKRQRVPSAYNQFIKEEIQRIKANNPDISHREAFSTAAKNWAHFPHIHFGLMLETNNQPKLDESSEKHLMSKAALLNK